MEENVVNRTSAPIKAIILIAPFCLWGTAMVAMKGVIATTTPLFLASFRLIPAGFLVLIVAAILQRKQPHTWQAWAWIALFGLVDGTLFQGFLAMGLERTGAGLGSVMIDSQPLAVAVMARFLFQEQVGFWGWLGLVIGILGISLLGLPDDWILQVIQGHGFDALPFLGSFSGTFSDGLSGIFSGTLWQGVWQTSLQQHGEWLMLLAALSMAVGTVLIRYVSRHVDPVVATGWHMVLGGLPLLGLAWQSGSSSWQNITFGGWLTIGYVTLFGSALAYGIFFYLAAQGNLTSLSALTFLTPVFALLFGRVFLAERLTQIQAIGVGLTLVSIYLINQRQSLTATLMQFLEPLLKAQKQIVQTMARLNPKSDEPS